MKKRMVMFGLLAVWLFLLAGLAPVWAQQPVGVTDDQVNEVAKELYCPLCTGLRLDNCQLKVCDGMRDVIRQKLEAGESKEQIKAYFVEQYGEVVLGVPSRKGFNLLAWVFPFLALVVAGGWVYYAARLWARRRAATAALPSALADLPAEYLQRLEEDLAEYG
ncbi:MAG: cytochrome c-type biogenesis protein CcmH [Anaerolineae bacterium]|nr:hypothetical protein [Stutzerimonas stutzeri]NIV33663.1 hypothetical protein [Anaerolineae bacterium]